MPASADPEQDRAIGQPATDHGEQHVLSRWIQTPARNSASRKSTKAFGSSASCIMILDTSTWSRKPCNPSTTRSARGCDPCLRYVPLPMSPGRTLLVLAELVLAEREGFEPPIGLHLCRISSAVHSTTLPPLQAPLWAVSSGPRSGRVLGEDGWADKAVNARILPGQTKHGRRRVGPPVGSIKAGGPVSRH